MGWNETVPPGVDAAYYHESQQQTVVGVAIFYMIISIATVAARFYARYLSGAGYWWDDWFALATVPLCVGMCIITLCTVPYGWGRHDIVVMNTDPTRMTVWFHRLFIVLFLYSASLATFKWSALALYVRIFSVYNWLRWTCIGLGAVIAVWSVLAEFLHLFRCNPISGQWSPEGASCMMDNIHFNLMISIPTIFFSFFTLVLPVHLVWKLQLPPITRIAVCGVFVLGGLDLVISILRLWTVVQNTGEDITWANCNMFYWSVAEPTSGLVCCCLVTYSPLIRAAGHKMGLSTGHSSSSRSSHFVQQPHGSSALYDRSAKHGTHRLGFPPGASEDLGTESHARWTEDGGNESDTVRLTDLEAYSRDSNDARIHVRKEVQVVTEEDKSDM